MHLNCTVKNDYSYDRVLGWFFSLQLKERKNKYGQKAVPLLVDSKK